jgi:aryl-alcohol dehydrogenase-like predicted oxidoreductase
MAPKRLENSLQYKRLETCGRFVSKLGFAMTCDQIEGYQTLGGLGQRDPNALAARAFEGGFNLIDTADSYALGASACRAKASPVLANFNR